MKTPSVNPKWLIGRTITDVELNRWNDGRGHTAHNPKIYLDNGAVISFNTEETEAGEYGTELIYSKPRKRK